MVEREHVAAADAVAGTNLDQDQIDEPQDMRGICDRLRKWNS